MCSGKKVISSLLFLAELVPGVDLVPFWTMAVIKRLSQMEADHDQHGRTS
jgi:hypothetical protein